MQFQLNSLTKMGKSCDKKNHSGVQSTLLTIRNRINLAESHIKVHFFKILRWNKNNRNYPNNYMSKKTK